MLGNKKLIRAMKLKNFLSFGPNGVELELQSLNVLIGKNGVGKSNFLDAMNLMRATSRDITAPLKDAAGALEWLWKGNREPSMAELDATMFNPRGIMPLRHKLYFSAAGPRIDIVDEAVENEHPEARYLSDVRFYYRFQKGFPVLNVFEMVPSTEEGQPPRFERKLKREEINPAQSIASQRKDADRYPEITYLASQYGQMRLYRDWHFGRYSTARMPQKADLPEDFLGEDASNLGLVLNNLAHIGDTGRQILDYLRILQPSITALFTKIYSGQVQVYVREEGQEHPIPATRLSEGVLRFLCLLSILCHPTPPPLVAIEEPELGLHPHIMPTLAELLVKASFRTQLIVTTHSDALVDALLHVPEAIVLCEKHDDATVMYRTDAENIKNWLDKYAIGETASIPVPPAPEADTMTQW